MTVARSLQCYIARTLQTPLGECSLHRCRTFGIPAHLAPQCLPQLLREIGLGFVPLPGVPRAEQEQLPVRHAAFSVEPVTLARVRTAKLARFLLFQGAALFDAVVTSTFRPSARCSLWGLVWAPRVSPAASLFAPLGVTGSSSSPRGLFRLQSIEQPGLLLQIQVAAPIPQSLKHSPCSQNSLQEQRPKRME